VAIGLWSVGVVLLVLTGQVEAAEPTLVALAENGALLRFTADRPGEVRTVRPSGVGRLVGIDVRPADGRLYALTAENDLYRIDADSGVGELLASLTVAFNGAERSGIAFNPQADRLRLIGWDGQNLRVHPTLGATAVDRPLAWKPGDPNGGHQPRVTAAAYTHDVPNAPDTKLFVIDAERDVLALQDPPNDGLLATVGPLGVDVGPLAGFAIHTDDAGHDAAWAATGGMLYGVDLGTGAAHPLGQIEGRPEVLSLAVLRR
jgi:hypothetical protein